MTPRTDSRKEAREHRGDGRSKRTVPSEALRQSEDLLPAVLERLPIGVWTETELPAGRLSSRQRLRTLPA